MKFLRFLPWRSARLGWAVAAGFLVAGVPLFVRMPPWCDLTLYDVAAHNLLRGGVHYRDVFDTNPPGFVACLVAIRTVLGPSVEAVRIVDLAVVAAVMGVLLAWAKRAGAGPAGVAWAAAGAAAFYPFSSEFNHCQRDVWMLLPAAMVGLRRTGQTGDRVFWPSVAEGVILGLAAWLKPHVLLPAAVVWLATARGVSVDRWRAAGRDFVGNCVGGLVVFAAGAGWLVGSGAWPYFREVFTFWNPGYLTMVLGELSLRADQQFDYFPPWSWFQPLGLGLAAWAVGWGNPARRALGAFYLAWTLQAFVLQRGFPYVHVPETLLLLALGAAGRVPVGFAGLVLVVATWHPVADRDRMGRWADCWRTELPDREYAERRNAVAFQTEHFAGTDWVQLGEVADFLRRRDVRDGEVIAWHDSPHTVYLVLGVRPGLRFQHVSTVTGIGKPQADRVRDELHFALWKVPVPRFAVGDLERVFNGRLPDQFSEMTEPGPGGPDQLPPAMRERMPRVCEQFPWDQPAVFRSGNGRGRYVVVEITEPVRDCRIPPGLGDDLPD